MKDPQSTIAAGLAGRLRSLVLALDRLDRLESGSGQWLAAFATVELAESAAALTLRLLHTASDPANFAILRSLATAESHPLPALITETGLGRLVLSERLNDLVQVGLVTRLIDTDHVQITAAGITLVQWVNEIAGQTAGGFLKRLTDGNEMPLLR